MMEDTYYQLEEALVQGFQTPEEYQSESSRCGL